jgi:hypothetical protein
MRERRFASPLIVASVRGEALVCQREAHGGHRHHRQRHRQRPQRGLDRAPHRRARLTRLRERLRDLRPLLGEDHHGIHAHSEALPHVDHLKAEVTGRVAGGVHALRRRLYRARMANRRHVYGLHLRAELRLCQAGVFSRPREPFQRIRCGGLRLDLERYPRGAHWPTSTTAIAFPPRLCTASCRRSNPAS